MNVHGPALKLHTKLTQWKILSDSAFHAHNAFKYSLSREDSNGQWRMGGQGGCALSSSLYLFIYELESMKVLRSWSLFILTDKMFSTKKKYVNDPNIFCYTFLFVVNIP